MFRDEPDPRPALAAFGVSAPAHPHPPGFSGASVWCVQSGRDRWALKAYPRTWGSARRLESIHRRLHRATHAGILVVPRPVFALDGRSVVDEHARLWDLVTWLPGAALLSTRPTPNHLSAALSALSGLHRAWRDDADPVARCPAVVRRLVALHEGASLGKLTLARDPLFGQLITEALDVLPLLTVLARRTLGPWRERSVPVQTTFGDLWHAHVLFDGDAVTGLIDHAAVKDDHVAADLARLLGSLGHVGIHALAGGALAAYAEQRPLAATDWELLDALLATGPAVQLAQWVRWLTVERRTFPDPDAAARRLAFLIQQGHACLSRGILVD
jgi:Ser/Thr protein kinase RdoA (MazF antagonist)